MNEYKRPVKPAIMTRQKNFRRTINVFRTGFFFLLFFSFITSNPASAQVDTEFWFVVPEISHRGSTGGKPGILKISSLELAADVTISMPANQYNAVTNPNGFKEINFRISPNAAKSVDLSYLIDDAANPGVTGLENKPLNISGINNFGLHITATNMITAFWEVDYSFGSDRWSLKGRNALGTKFYTPFQTVYDNRNLIPRAYSAIDIVSTQDNTQVTITLPTGIAASYGSTLNSIAAGGTFTITLNRGQTFSVFPLNYSVAAPDRLAGTKIESTMPIAVTVKDDALNVPSQGQDLIGDQLVPADVVGNSYIVPEMANPNHVYVVATENNTRIYVYDAEGLPISGSPYAILNEGDQQLVIIPNGAKFGRITSSTNPGDPSNPFYVFQLAIENAGRGGALVPPIGCTGNTDLSFSRARDEKFYFILITEEGNQDNFLIDGIRDDILINPDGFTSLQGSGGWVAYFSNSIPASKLSIGQHLMKNTGGVFHLAVMSGLATPSGKIYYGFHSDFGRLNIGATVAGTNSSVVRSCYEDNVQLTAFGGTNYQWTPADYLNNSQSKNPVAVGLPPGPHLYNVAVTGACATGVIDLTVIVSPPIIAGLQADKTTLCSPDEVTFTDASEGVYSWTYTFSDNRPAVRYDLDPATTAINEPPGYPEPYSFTESFVNTSDRTVKDSISLLVKNQSGCHDATTTAIFTRPGVKAEFTMDATESCGPVEVVFTNLSTGADVYEWNFGDGTTSTSPGPEISKLFTNTTATPVTYNVTLTVTNEEGCSDQFSRTITINPQVNAAFAATPLEVCSPGEVLFENQSSGANQYTWDFGDGTITNEIHPIHFYEKSMIDHDTIFTVRLVAISSEGCRDTSYIDIVIHPYLEANMTAEQTSYCTPATVEISNHSLGADLYYWDFGDGSPVSNSSSNTISHIYMNLSPEVVEYNLQLVVKNDEGCSDTITKTITVNPELSADFASDVYIGCHPLEVAFTDLSLNASEYLWDFGDGHAETVPSPQHTFSNTGLTDSVYSVLLTVKTADGFCADAAQFDITVHPQINAAFNTSATAGCTPLEVTFENNAVGGLQYTWDFGDGTVLNTADKGSMNHTFVNTGYASDQEYEVTLTAENAQGCVSSATHNIRVYPGVESDFTSSATSGCLPLEVFFNNTSSGAASYAWDFGDENTSDLVEPAHTFMSGTQEDSSFTVQLLSIAPNGICRDSSTVEIKTAPASEGGILAYDHAMIDLGQSTGVMALADYTGEVVMWQRRRTGEGWTDINYSGFTYMETPFIAGTWNYRALVQNSNCPGDYSEQAEIEVLPMELWIYPDTGQYKLKGDPDPVFTYTNSIWDDNSEISGSLGRKQGEAVGEYTFTLGDLDAGPNYLLSLDPDPTFSIIKPTGLKGNIANTDLELKLLGTPEKTLFLLQYRLPREGKVSLQLVDITGRTAAILLDDLEVSEGTHLLRKEDMVLVPGIYILKMQYRSQNHEIARSLKFIW